MPGGNQSAVHKWLIMTCLIVAGSLPVVEAQAVSHPKVSIDLGSVTVWLGMSQTNALAQFQSAGYKVLGDGTTARTDVQDGGHVYSIWFKGGKVICAEREWYSSGRDEMDAVIGALAAMASHGAHSCSVMHDAINEPDQSAERILIDCGQRSVYLAKGKTGSSNPVNYVSAFERVGQIP
jgi:hypothetical protein